MVAWIFLFSFRLIELFLNLEKNLVSEIQWVCEPEKKLMTHSQISDKSLVNNVDTKINPFKINFRKFTTWKTGNFSLISQKCKKIFNNYNFWPYFQIMVNYQTSQYVLLKLLRHLSIRQRHITSDSPYRSPCKKDLAGLCWGLAQWNSRPKIGISTTKKTF